MCIILNFVYLRISGTELNHLNIFTSILFRGGAKQKEREREREIVSPPRDKYKKKAAIDTNT
jgi:hypothetical protein